MADVWTASRFFLRPAILRKTGRKLLLQAAILLIFLIDGRLYTAVSCRWSEVAGLIRIFGIFFSEGHADGKLHKKIVCVHFYYTFATEINKTTNR
ncbi:hypothetical protein [uncultured Bacteroides sp.]|uniref:hypothetical protein n=1 Tax=uncultured Bacteroides sp. TaxID=162156 RepID=UPI00261583DF|nr:hypothetical protein [uncultured Bacteroides sp.]